MITSASVRRNEGTREFLLAPDLGAWLNRRNLVMLVLDVVQKVDDSRLQPDRLIAGGHRSQPRTLLTILTYCYAAGIYGSRKIVRLIDIDETLRYLCANHPPDSTSLCHFREQNREILEQCLAKVCLVAWKTKFGSWQRERFGQETKSAPANCRRIDPSFHSQIVFEVMERLNKAQRQDGDKIEP